MYISVKDLILFGIGMLVAILLLVIIALIVNINRIVKKTFTIVEQNEENISNLIEETPKLVQNLNTLTTSSQNIVDNVDKTVENVSCFVEEKTVEFSSFSKIILDIMRVVLEFIKK